MGRPIPSITLILTLTINPIITLLTLTVTLKRQKLASIRRSAQHVYISPTTVRLTLLWRHGRLTLLWRHLRSSQWAALIDGKLPVLVAWLHYSMGLPVLYTLHCPYVIKGTTEPERQHTTTFHITQFSHHFPLTFRIFHCAFYVMHYTIPHSHSNYSPTDVPTSNRRHTTLRKSSYNVTYRPQTSSINFVCRMYLNYVKCILNSNSPQLYCTALSVYSRPILSK